MRRRRSFVQSSVRRGVRVRPRVQGRREPAPAEQMIYHDAEHPSHVLLPVIPGVE